MRRLLRHHVHPLNPQVRLLQDFATLIRAGSIVAVPSAAGYGLVCRLDDKAASGRLRRCADPEERAPATLLCRDLAQAAGYLQIDDHAFRALREAVDGCQSFALRSRRSVPRRLASAAGGICLLQFGGHPALQGLLALLDEALLIALPPTVAASIAELPDAWQAVLDAALDSDALPEARPAPVVDPDGLLQARQRLSRWLGAMPAPAAGPALSGLMS